MKAKIINIFWLLLLSVAISAQIYDKNFEIKTEQGGYSREFVGRDYIKLQKGFKWQKNSGTNNKFIARLDDNLLFDADYVSVPDPATFDINANLQVGTVSAQFNVSETGAATYSVPIMVANGTNGLQPQLSINYSNQAGYGLLGWGWNIGGLSAITRTGRTIIHDSKVTGVKFNAEDRFLLNGNRLQLINGDSHNYGSDGAEYRTEIDNFDLITSHGTASDGAVWFEVITKSGLTIQYGNGNNSKFPSSGKALVWYINKIIDKNNNYINYIYDELFGNIYIKSIGYGSNIEAYNRIDFLYEIRSDKSNKYINGILINDELIVRSIKSYSDGNLLREYKFNYFTKNITDLSVKEEYSFLSEIIETYDGQEQFNSLKFSYGDCSYTNSSDIQLPDNLTQLSNADYITGDYDGNGRQDVVAFIKNSSNSYTSFKLFINIDGAFTEKISNGTLPSNFFPIDPENPLINGIRNLDINGDGKSDLLLGTRTGSNYSYKAYFFDGTDFVLGNSFSCNTNHFFTVGDYDGNGQIDLFMYNYSSGIWNVYKNNSTVQILGTGYFDNTTSTYYNTLDGSYLYPIDYDGDGTTEIAAVTNNKLIVLDFDFTVSEKKLYKIDENEVQIMDMLAGDFNGDRITDMLIKKSTGSNNTGWFFSYGEGNNNSGKYDDTYSVNLKSIPYNTSTPVYKVTTGDFNGDGLTDIVQVYKSTDNTEIMLDVFFSNGDYGFNKKSPSITSTFTIDNNTKLFTGDFDGNGTEDIFIANSNSNIVVTLDNSKEEFLLKNIFDGLGNLTEINYKPLTHKDVYTPDNSTTFSFPVVSDIIPAIYVVSELKLPDGIGGTNITQFTYKGFRLHKQGKGFLGYKETTTSNLNRNKKIINTYDINSTHYMPELVSSEVKTLSDEQISKTENTYFYEVFDNNNFRKRFFRYISNTTSHDYLTLKTISSVLSYNATDVLYGNISSITKNFNNEQTETTTFLNYSSEGSWCPYLVGEKSVSIIEGTDPAFTRKVNYTYNTNGSLLQQITDGDKTKKVTIDYEYTGHGNVMKVTVSASDIDSRITQYDYDSKGRFLEKTTVPFGDINFVTESKYDSRTGNLIWSKNVNNLITSYKYDGFGRLTETTLPNLKKVKNSLHWCNGTNPQYSRYYSLIEADGQDDFKTYYDILGREIRTESTAYNGSILYADKSYNQKGELIETTEPYIQGNQHLSVGYDYYYSDGRINNIYNKLNGSTYSTTNYTYSDASITVSKTIGTDIQSSSKTYDALGRLSETSDNSGIATTYTYHTLSTGLKTEIASGINTIKIETDEYGRQKSLDDPDAGKIDYIYNSIGELTYQKDARSKEFTMTYDILGRIKTKTSPEEGLTEYQYDSKTYGKGLLASVSNDIAGTSVEYTYNQYGQPTVVKETIDGLNFITKYEYNIYGAVTKITYPSNSSSSPFSVTQHYNSRGYMTEVTNSADGASIWKLDAINDRGQISKYFLGDKINTEHQYDNYGFPSITSTGTTSLPSTIQEKTYLFDENWGRPYEISNFITSDNEVFGYDEDNILLNRLTSYSFNNSVIETQFSIDGNISFKTEAGNYNYDGIKPHAVSSVSNPDNLIPETVQEISYNSFNKVSRISEDEIYTLDFTYGIDNERRKTVYSELDIPKITKYYSTNYEKIKNESTEATRELHYIFAGDGLCAVMEKTGTTENMYYPHKDYLGSITEITDKDGVLLQRINYDAWGNRTLTYNNSVFSDFILDRGYTGHEHLDQFSLINMNGRLYDPMLGRMLSPDNYVQGVGSQGFNRFSYALNNPMIFTDPDGNNPMYLALGIFVVGSVLDHWLNPGDYDDANMWQATKAGFNQGTHAFSEINSVAQVKVYSDDNWNVSISPSLVSLGVNANVSYTNGDWTIGGSVGYNSVVNPETNVSGFQTTVSQGVSYYNEESKLGFSLGGTWFRGVNPQFNWIAGGRYDQFSFRTTNDLGWGDKYRSAAAEFGIGDYYVGFNVYTSEPNKVPNLKKNTNGGAEWSGSIWNKVTGHNDCNETYSSGKIYSSPFYIGTNYMGNTYRAGINHPIVQDIFQNGMHRLINTPSFQTPYGSYSSPYLYYGQYKPYNLY